MPADVQKSFIKEWKNPEEDFDDGSAALRNEMYELRVQRMNESGLDITPIRIAKKEVLPVIPQVLEP